MLRHLIILMLIISVLATNPYETIAQPSKDPGRKPTPAVEAAPPATQSPDFIAEAERSAALSLINSLAERAKDYEDEALRARVLARSADALWEHDRERARALFHRAWEVAEAVDEEGLRRVEEERRNFLSGRRASGMIPPAPNVRAQILRLASQRDRALGEELLAKLNDAQEKRSDEPVAAKIYDPTEPPQAIAKRLELARQLLEGGEVERAILFAEPGLKQTTSQGIIFLVALRQKKPAVADGIYTALLRIAATDPATDATVVSLLSTYLFTPSILVTATQNGRLSHQWSETLPPPDVSPALRSNFFRVAAQVLLRPLPGPDQDRSSAGRGGTYFTIARLLPLFDRHSPEHAPALRALLATLAQDAPAAYRADREGMLSRGLAPEASAGEELQNVLNRLDLASNSFERDALHASAARIAAINKDPRAREYADKIEGEFLRKRVRAFVDFAAVRDAIGEKRHEDAMRLARASEFDPLLRVWAYTETARLLQTSSPERAIEILDEAATVARRLDPASTERAHALLAVAAQMMKSDRGRGWENAAEAVKTVNRVRGFTGEDAKVGVRLQTSDNFAIMESPAPSFNLATLFAALAADDLHRTVALANSFADDAPRANAIIAIARSVLERVREKEKAASGGPRSRPETSDQ